MLIIVDTREQKPLWKGNAILRKKLDVGDYTTEKLLGIYHIERKSLCDLYGTLTKGHLRFKKEIYRAKDSGVLLEVFVEGSRKDFVNKNFYGGGDRLIKSSTLNKMITTMQKRHVNFVWCSCRAVAKKQVMKQLKKMESKF